MHANPHRIYIQHLTYQNFLSSKNFSISGFLHPYMFHTSQPTPPTTPPSELSTYLHENMSRPPIDAHIIGTRLQRNGQVLLKYFQVSIDFTEFCLMQGATRFAFGVDGELVAGGAVDVVGEGCYGESALR